MIYIGSRSRKMGLMESDEMTTVVTDETPTSLMSLERSLQLQTPKTLNLKYGHRDSLKLHSKCFETGAKQLYCTFVM